MRPPVDPQPWRCETRAPTPVGGQVRCMLEAGHPERHDYNGLQAPPAGWGPHDFALIPGEELRWQCSRPKCGAIYVGADPPDAGWSCPVGDEIAARRARPPAVACVLAACDVPKLCARVGKCAALMNRQIENDPASLEILDFLCSTGAIVGPGVVASRPRLAFPGGGNADRWPRCRCGHLRGDHGDDGDCAADGGCPCGIYAPALGAVPAAGRDTENAAGVGGRVAIPDSGVAGPTGLTSPGDVGRGAERAPGVPGAETHRTENRLSPGRDTDARGIPIATVAAVHIERIAATLRVAGVCACTACVAFTVAHEVDVLPMLAPAISGRYAPGHGPAPQKPGARDRKKQVFHPASVRPKSRGKK